MKLYQLNALLGTSVLIGGIVGGMTVKGYDSRSVATEPVFATTAPKISALVSRTVADADPSISNVLVTDVPNSQVSLGGEVLSAVRVTGNDSDGPIAFLIIVDTYADGSVHIGGGTYAQ